MFRIPCSVSGVRVVTRAGAGVTRPSSAALTSPWLSVKCVGTQGDGLALSQSAGPFQRQRQTLCPVLRTRFPRRLCAPGSQARSWPRSHGPRATFRASPGRQDAFGQGPRPPCAGTPAACLCSLRGGRDETRGTTARPHRRPASRGASVLFAPKQGEPRALGPPVLAPPAREERGPGGLEAPLAAS